MGDAPRLLIVKLSSMGDVIHALPVVNDIMGALPGAQIDWVIEEGFSTLPRLHPGIRKRAAVALRRWRTTLFAPSTWRELRAGAPYRARNALRPHHRRPGFAEERMDCTLGARSDQRLRPCIGARVERGALL